MSALVQTAQSWVNAGLAFIFPENCQLCGQGRATASQGFVCADCRSQVRVIQPPFCSRCGMPFAGAITGSFQCSNCRDSKLYFRSARSAVLARDKVLEAIHRYKYHRALWFEPFLADLLIEQARPALAGERWDLIVPVPLHPLKQRQREFNQAERLAQRLSVALGLPLNRHLLRRTVPTRTQTQLSREERAANVRNAFALERRAKLSGEWLVLVDDVLTTGATTSACAKALREGGAGDICVWTVARGI